MIYNANCLKPVKQYDRCFKWFPLNDRMVRESVKGPFTIPMVAVPFPCVFQQDDDGCDCAEELRKCYSRRGIPDPWKEYLLVKEGTEKGCINPGEFPKTDLNITKYLGESYRLDFGIGQGIPDPWKKWVTFGRAKESTQDNLRPDVKKYLANGSDIYEADSVRCPNCNRQLLVFCLNGFEKKGRRKETLNEKFDGTAEETPVVDKTDERVPAVTLKDACVETDKVVPVEKRKSEESKSCTFQGVQRSGCTCEREVKPKACKCREEDDSSDSGCISCRGRRSHLKQRKVCTPICVHNFLPFLPSNEQFRSGSLLGHPTFLNEASSMGKDQQQYQPVVPPPANTSLPPSLTLRPEHYTWLSPGFFPCGNTNGHLFELKWVCRKCEGKKKKKRRKGSQKSEERVGQCKHFLREASKRRNTDYSPYLEGNHDDSDSCGIYKISRVRPENYPSSSCHCDEGASKTGNVAASGKPHDTEVIQLLHMLGCSDIYRNKCNTDYNEPMVNVKWTSGPSTSRQVTHAYVPVTDFPNPNFSHWKNPPYTHSEDIPTRNEAEDDRTNLYKPKKSAREGRRVTFGNYEASSATTYSPNVTVDKGRNLNTVLRKRKEQFSKWDLNNFTSECNENGDESASSEVERAKMSHGGARSINFGRPSER